MRLLLRERWPLLVGALGALAALAAFAVAGPGARDWAPLGVALAGWCVALLVLALGLALQLVLAGRISLRRERRLVDSGVMLRVSRWEMERLASTDVLTDLDNRRGFTQRLGAEFRRSRRYARPLALLMIDLDRFKQVNDGYGHPFGDQLLVKIASLLRAQLRESDALARYGGEEFVVLLPETDEAAAVSVAEKLRAAVAAHEFVHDGRSARMTISIGVADLDALPGAADEQALVACADRALYRAKGAGRNRVALGDGDDGGAQRRAIVGH